MSRLRFGPTRPGFRPYRDRSGRWRWRLLASNGLVVAVSGESFTSRAACLRGIAAARAAAAGEGASA